jgi:hypothetical protein
MTSSRLTNYLLANRKRLQLSQVEVAFLLNAGTGEKVCRHESFIRMPNLENALAYEVIFKRTTSELFAGLYDRIEKDVVARAKILLNKIDGRKSNRRNDHIRQVIADIAGVKSIKPR